MNFRHQRVNMWGDETIFVSAYETHMQSICDLFMSLISRCSSLTGYELDALTSIPVFDLRHHFQTGSGAHPASYSLYTRCYFPGSKAVGT
jgi:hypothetical protein